MILSNTDTIHDREVAEMLGLVMGNTVRARHVGRDLIAVFRQIVGGEVSQYSRLLSESRQQAVDRMVEEATSLGADAVVNIRFTTAAVAGGTAEILAYGTAVKLR